MNDSSPPQPVDSLDTPPAVEPLDPAVHAPGDTGPTGQTDPAEPTEPTDPIEPVEPIEPAPPEPPRLDATAEADDAAHGGREDLRDHLPPRLGPGLSFGFNLGKIPGHGEDSDPIVRDGRELGLVGVFDGMGGAGGTVYETPEGPRTGAYLASRIARDVVEQRMVELLDPEWNLNGGATARDLQRSVRAALQQRLVELNAPTSGLRSRLLRALPTTMALVALQRREPGGDRWAGHVFWAGDSRAYVLDPERGAQQLSVDDIKDHGDAMANLRQDSVVSNAMSADTDFVVHHSGVELTAPFVVLAATDGCFGYLPSPMHFEHLILAALRDSSDAESWSAGVQAAISAVTGDDAAMAVLGVGADHEQFQRLFARRTAELAERWIDPLDAATSELERREREVAQLRASRELQQAQLWAAYKPGYERYLDSPGRERS